MQKAFQQVDTFNAEVRTAGAWVFGGGRAAPAIATVVDAPGSDVVITDGPFGETKEHLGGFWIITAPDLDAALAWATRGSAACMGPVEVRPFQSDTEALNDD
ncbi:MAG: YciI family protein [Acidimicrobiales bacterium]